MVMTHFVWLAFAGCQAFSSAPTAPASRTPTHTAAEVLTLPPPVAMHARTPEAAAHEQAEIARLRAKLYAARAAREARDAAIAANPLSIPDPLVVP